MINFKLRSLESEMEGLNFEFAPPPFILIGMQRPNIWQKAHLALLKVLSIIMFLIIRILDIGEQRRLLNNNGY